ncbi:MAG: Rrf2 family transcriptional regulator [Candidatus Omnitrophota bacterium]|nr:Rrf2 family transcriptional regulator [Candidatus Omnitrophota bacterium]
MRITYKGDYALKTILDLSLHHGSGPVTIHDLAKRADIPIKFLEQILLDLKKGGFVESRRGKIGGYLLAKTPSQTKLGEVVRFIDGPVDPIACVETGYAGCKDIYKCVFKGVWQKVAKATSDIIDNMTFEDLVKQINTHKEAVIYQI